MKVKIISCICFLYAFASNTNSLAQTLVLQNTGVFCYDQYSSLWNNVIDETGNYYHIGEIRDSAYLNGNNIGFSENKDSNSIIFVKTNSVHELVWTKTFPIWHSGFRNFVTYKGGMTGLFMSFNKGTYAPQGLAPISNDEKSLIYAINIDSTGNNSKMFPLIKFKEGGPGVFFNILYSGYDNDTLVMSGTLKGSAWFGKNNVYIDQNFDKDHFFISRFTEDGDFIDIQYPFAASTCVNRGILVEDGKVFSLFTYKDTLFPKNEVAIPPIPNIVFIVSWDIALSCYDIRQQKTIWLNTLRSQGDMNALNYSNNNINFDNAIGLNINPGASIISLNGNEYEVTLKSDVFMTFDKETGNIIQKIIVEGENTTLQIYYNFEDQSSVLLSVNNFGKYIKINGEQYDFPDIINEKKSVFFRITESLNSYLGMVSGKSSLSIFSILFNNKGIPTIYSSFSNTQSPINIFGTEIQACNVDRRVKILTELSELTGVENVVQSTETMNMKVWPNPFSDILNISVNSSETEHYKLEILNMQGQICHADILNHSTGQYTVDLSRFSSGMYYMVAENSQGKIFAKLIKTK